MRNGCAVLPAARLIKGRPSRFGRIGRSIKTANSLINRSMRCSCPLGRIKAASSLWEVGVSVRCVRCVRWGGVQR